MIENFQRLVFNHYLILNRNLSLYIIIIINNEFFKRINRKTKSKETIRALGKNNCLRLGEKRRSRKRKITKIPTKVLKKRRRKET